MNSEFEWPDAAIVALKSFWADGLSLNSMALRLNETYPGAKLTKSAVAGKAHRLGLPSRPSPIKPVAKKVIAELAVEVVTPAARPARTSMHPYAKGSPETWGLISNQPWPGEMRP